VSARLEGLDAVRCALDGAARSGARAADAVLAESEAGEARVRGDELEFVTQARERTLGIRVFVEGRRGLRSAVTSTSDLSREAVERLAADTVALAGATAEDPDAGLPAGGFAVDAPELALLDPADRQVPMEARIEEARRAEAAGRGTDPRVVNSEGSEASARFTRIAYASSAGFQGSYEGAVHALSSMPVAAENGAMQTDYWITIARRRSSLETPETVGRRAAERALRRLGARRVPTCSVPVIFDAPTARSLLGNLAACLSGYSVYRQGSFLAERLGDAIASPAITVVDDGRLPGGLASRPFDGEGLPTRRTVVVDGGRLASWLLDTYSARKLGLESTGNASRSAGSAPTASPTNLWIEPGATSLDEMVQNTGKGLLVTGLFGHGFNPVTGDFSRGVRGLWIEGGEPAFPVEEITVAGNLGDMLQRIDAVGTELLWLGSIAAPPLRVAAMMVAGV
jgi:PmbA protein